MHCLGRSVPFLLKWEYEGGITLNKQDGKSITKRAYVGQFHCKLHLRQTVVRLRTFMSTAGS